MITRLSPPAWATLDPDQRIERATGLPCRALVEQSTSTGSTDVREVLTGGYPLRPILPGFIINTLFYAAIWFGAFFGVAALRRFDQKETRAVCEVWV